MINIIKGSSTTTVNKVYLDKEKVSSVFVDKVSTGRKYFTFYDSAISVSRSGSVVSYSMDYYNGHTLGFFIGRYSSGWPIASTHYSQKSFNNGPGASFNVNLSGSLNGAVGVILFMHPFATDATVAKYANAFNQAFSPTQMEILIGYNYDFLSNSGNSLLPSFFDDYGIDRATCNEECFGMITVHSSPSSIDFITKSAVFQ